MSVNAFSVAGRLVRDVHSGVNGSVPFSLYTIAENYAYTDRDGKRKHGTNFVPVVSYGAQAEADARYLNKGRAVAVSGRIVSWFKRSERRGGLTLRVTSVDYLDGATHAADADSGGEDAHDAWVRDYCAFEVN